MNKTKNQNKVSKGTFGEIKKIDDFLPTPESLIFKKPEAVKVTMMMDKASVNFFKNEAKKLGGSYQRMIRNLLSEYASNHQV